MQAELSPHQQSVADYYNANHSRFLRFGKRGETGAMHRAVWGPDVQNHTEALQFVNRLIAREISERFNAKLLDIHILDIGCGVGATCLYLAIELGAYCTGISVSHPQITEANRRAAEVKCEDRCSFLLEDFTAMDNSRQFHAASAIESFVHFEDQQKFFRKCAEAISDDGILIICDDFREKGSESHRKAEAYLNRFKRGWRLGNVLNADETISLAGEAGFTLEQNRDLTPYLQIPTSPLAQLEKLAYLIPLRTPFLDSRRGSVALRICYKHGWLEYRFLVFRKS